MTDDTLSASLAGPANVAGTDTGRRCQAGRILDTTTPANRAAILHMLHSRREDGDQYVTDQELARRLRDGGRPCSASLLSYHRTRLCVCDTFAPDESETA